MCSVKMVFLETPVPESLFLNKVADLRPATLLKKETLEQVFSSELCEISKNTFSYRKPPVAASKYLQMVSVNTVMKDFLYGVKALLLSKDNKRYGTRSQSQERERPETMNCDYD